jgi:outer membrane protein OmpA-like peptidoglycan-associated protein
MFVKLISISALIVLSAIACSSGQKKPVKLSTEETKALEDVMPVADAAPMKTFNITAQFPSGSANLTTEGKKQINPAGEYIKANIEKVKTVFIEGHSDAQGPDEFNRLLSERRAQIVKNYLVRTFKIEADMVKAIGFGESSPIADNSTPEGRLQNRRVIIKVK